MAMATAFLLPEPMEKHVDPSASDIHQGRLRSLGITSPRGEVIEILAGAVFALIAEGRMSPSHVATQRAPVIP
jgi:hypothetical protein